MPAVPITSHKPRSSGHDWFERHLPELASRCRAFMRRVPSHDREEAQAETLGSIFQYVLRAAERGKLSALTPFTLVSFFGRGVCEGRRMTGTSTKDLLSEACHRHHGLRVVSLDDPHVKLGSCSPGGVQFSEALVDPKADRPLENVRRDIDYPEILEREGASPKARRVFEFLCETAGAGKQKHLARELGVSEPRVCQLKGELADMLSAHGYGPSVAHKPQRRPSKLRRPAGQTSAGRVNHTGLMNLTARVLARRWLNAVGPAGHRMTRRSPRHPPVRGHGAQQSKI
jgi:hypothetical protein